MHDQLNAAAVVMLFLGALVAVLQTVGMWVLKLIWSEIKGVRARLHEIENWAAGESTARSIREFGGPRPLPPRRFKEDD